MALSAALCGVALSACSQESTLGSEQVNVTTPSPQHKTPLPPPEAPSLSEQEMEDFKVDPKLAKKLKEADDVVSDGWYIDQLDKANIDIDPSISFVLRDRICSEIEDGANIHVITGDVLSSYRLTGKQQGVMIASSMLSQCSDKKLSVPAGSFDNEKEQ